MLFHLPSNPRYHSPFFCSFLILRSAKFPLQTAEAVDEQRDCHPDGSISCWMHLR